MTDTPVAVPWRSFGAFALLMLPVLLMGCPGDAGTIWGGGGKPGDGGSSGNIDDTGDDTGDTGADSGDTGDTGRPELECTGYDVGDIACDLTAELGSGESWSLYDQYGSQIVLIAGQLDYPTTVDTLEGLADVAKAAPDALIVLLVGRDEYSIAADEADAAGWIALYDIDVVLLDPTSSLVNQWSEFNPPRSYVIDETMTIVLSDFGAVDSDDLIAALK